MGNTVTFSVGNSGVVAPAASEGGGTNISVGAAEEEDEEELGCLEKLGCLLCSG